MKRISLLFFFLHMTMTRALCQDVPNIERPWVQHGRLEVSKEDSHFLSFEDGKPFFWLGDTGWEAIHLLTREQIADYFKIRKMQGFNVIQTVIISEFGGLTKPNAYASLPFKDSDPAHLAIEADVDKVSSRKYDYWDHVDFTIGEAERQGLFIALLPCWGEYVVPREGNALFKTVQQAYAYGNFLGKRYHHKKNVIWILGGDRRPDEIPDGITLWRAMAKGIADGTNGSSDFTGVTDYSTTLMTYHCSASSSKWFQDDQWLDFNMWGSYHDNYSNTIAYEQVYKDDSLALIKPTINGEPAYEDAPVNWLPENGTFKAYDVRQIAYWSVFAGACGHTYGCSSVWQFYDKQRGYGIFNPVISWQNALFDDGAIQLKYLKNLMESRPQFHRVQANNLIIKGEGSGNDRCIATMGRGYAFIYLPTGYPITVALNKIGFFNITAWWFNPRNGNVQSIGKYNSHDTISFSPPCISKELTWLKTGRGCDWVLVLDDSAIKFLQPGVVQ